MKRNYTCLLAGLCLLTAPLLPALADDSNDGTATTRQNMPSADDGLDHWLEGKYLLGDFGGERTRLEEKGVEFFAFYTTDVAGNPSGGKNPGNLTYTDDIFFGVNLYLAKLLGWTGTSVYLSGIRRDGHSLTNSYVGSIYNAQQDYGGQNIFLYQVAIEQLFGQNDDFSIKAGRFSASDDFNNSPIYNLYMTNGIDGDIRNVLFDTQFSAYPFNTWAARLDYFPTREVELKLGVFQTTSNVFARSRNGIDWDIRGDDGVFLIGQVNWSPEFFKRPVPADGAAGKSDGADGKGGGTSKMKGLQGHYNFGGSYSPWNGYNEFGTTRTRASSYGFFAHADQQVYQPRAGSKMGLTLWAAGAIYPQNDIAIVPYQAEGGLIYEGLFPTREKDKVILGAVYGKFSHDFADVVRASGGGIPDHEAVFEAAYRFQLTQFLYFQPDFQYYVRPFGTGRIEDAAIVGTQAGIVF